MRLKLQAVLMVMVLRRRWVVGALIAGMLLILWQWGYTLLVVDQDTIDAALSATLVLWKTAHLVLNLAFSISRLCLPRRCGDLVNATTLLLVNVAILERTILGSRQHHTLAILGGSRRRGVEIEDALYRALITAIVLVSKLRTGSRWSKSFNRATFTSFGEIFLYRHIAHQGTLRSLDLVKELSLVADFDR